MLTTQHDVMLQECRQPAKIYNGIGSGDCICWMLLFILCERETQHQLNCHKSHNAPGMQKNVWNILCDWISCCFCSSMPFNHILAMQQSNNAPRIWAKPGKIYNRIRFVYAYDHVHQTCQMMLFVESSVSSSDHAEFWWRDWICCFCSCFFVHRWSL